RRGGPAGCWQSAAVTPVTRSVSPVSSARLGGAPGEFRWTSEGQPNGPGSSPTREGGSCQVGCRALFFCHVTCLSNPPGLDLSALPDASCLLLKEKEEDDDDKWAFVMKKHLNTHMLGRHGIGNRKESSAAVALVEEDRVEQDRVIDCWLLFRRKQHGPRPPDTTQQTATETKC
ncbi:hypothetical protein NHX12_001324, partial [Muraenolepis orangiensis]